MAGSVTLQAVFETLNWPQAGLDVHRNGERTMMHLTHYMCTRYARTPSYESYTHGQPPFGYPCTGDG